jgi:hypothetical protein
LPKGCTNGDHLGITRCRPKALAEGVVKKIALAVVMAATLNSSAYDKPAQSSPATAESQAQEADSLEVTHELQEKCARDAAELFTREWPLDGLKSALEAASNVVLTHTSHYSINRRQCFLHVTLTYTYRGNATMPELDFEQESLVEVLEKRAIGQFTGRTAKGLEVLIIQCYVGEAQCKTGREVTPESDAHEAWLGLAKPYLEE